MKKDEKIKKICKILSSAYPDVKTQLSHKNPFQLLIATILSAQCTDRQVNSVTPKLFKELPEPENFAKAPIEKIEKLIRSTGFFHNKAKNIKKCAKVICHEYKRKVPDTIDELVKLPGVGRKTANVVLSAAFGKDAMVVDTHVKRIAKRLGMTKNTDPVKIEFDLMKIVPKKNWNNLGLELIYFGREICTARNPKCSVCQLYDLCEYDKK